MRIGLVTWIGCGNFGTSLQSFALHEKLKLLGYDVYIIGGYKHVNPIKGIIKLIIKKIGIRKNKNRETFKKRSSNGLKIYEFIESNYNKRNPLLDAEFNRMIKHTDVFVTGSDQIWNVKYNFNPFMFLDFAGNKKRVAYASSIGISYIPDEYKEKVKNLLSKFSHIGVREKTAVDVLTEVVGRNDIIQVLDPTFLLTSKEWTDFSSNAKYEIDIPEKFILCYLIGNNEWYNQQIEEVKKKSGIKNMVIIPAVENPNFTIDDAIIYKNACPYEFVDLIKRSSLVCTDSFHATAISINLSKDFVEFLRFKEREGISQNSRIYDILEHYGLRYKLYSSENDDWVKNIDYAKVQKLLNVDRKKSLAYLTNAIEN